MQPIQIDFTNAFADAVGAEHGVTNDDLKDVAARLSGTKIDFPFMALPADREIVAEILRAAESVKCRFQNLVVLGIGGSALGMKMLQSALLPPFFNYLDTKARGGFPKLFICDNIDPDNFTALLKLIDLKTTCVNVISKSGRTTETAAQFYIIKDMLIKKLGSKRWKEHVIITTDGVSGPLRTLTTIEHLNNFSIPEKIGGRYSVLSAVGLLPAACAGIDIKALLDGAGQMAERCKAANIEENPALKNAVVHYIMDTVKHKPMSVMMPYADSLALFSDWYAQLMAESLGKNGRGPTPLKATGVIDQHSQLQLYMDGPADKVVTFVRIEEFTAKISVPHDVDIDFSYIKDRDMGDILRTEQLATAKALAEAKRPSITITLPNASPASLGQLIMMYQVQTALAGALYEVDPFDQPAVELGKKLTKEILTA